MFAILATREADGFTICTWTEPQTRAVDGRMHTAMPHPQYDPVVEVLWNLLYKTSAWIHPYDPLPEDPERVREEGIAFSVLGVSHPPEFLARASLNQVRRYLVLCTRGERFGDGHIAGEFESGALLAALRRLRELRGDA